MRIGIPVESLPGWQGWTFTVTPGDEETRETVTVQAPLGATFDPDKWRRLPIGRVLSIVRTACQAPMATLLAQQVPAVKRPHGGSAAHRHAVRDVYRIAISQGVSPAELIRERWQLAKDGKTASEWIKQCREAGDLLPTYREEVELARQDPFDGSERRETPATPRLTGQRRSPGRGSTASAKTKDIQ